MYTYIDMCLSTDISCLLIDLSTDVTCLFWPQVSMMVIWDQFHRTSAHHSIWTNTSISASTCFQEYLASEFIIFICYSFFSDKGQRSFFRKFSMVPSLNAVKYSLENFTMSLGLHRITSFVQAFMTEGSAWKKWTIVILLIPTNIIRQAWKET